MSCEVVLSGFAVGIAIVAAVIAIKASCDRTEYEVWWDLRFKRVQSRTIDTENRVMRWMKRVEESINKEEESCQEPCRPRSYVTLGEGEGKIFVLLPERKKELCKEASKPHKVDEYCVGCNNLIALGGTKPACALDRKCEGYEKKGE